ncbi:MAG: type I-C CRISPR-associated protein Cas8c/Csd1 [Desulfobacteraceae bacterium]|jgi:CRISPR-associated protein Csd1|nr:MAG: type I-C CRISPR-associated protein Cas8c/Csd1 [Desulfobacteraceae bacterium]
MILQALYDYYERKAQDPESGIAPVGFEWKEIPFLIVIDVDGNVVNLENTREGTGKRAARKMFLLPKSEGRTGQNSWQTTFLLWDHYGYVLGQPKLDEDRAKAIAMAEKQLGTFIAKLSSLPALVQADKYVAAVLKFYEKGEYKKVPALDNWSDCSSLKGCNLTFRLQGETEPVTGRKAVVEYQKANALLPDETETYEANCLITGKKGIVQRLSASTAIPGGQASGKLVGFQKEKGFDSYGKEQGFNAPVSKYAHAAYTTALNTLIKGETQMLVGDTTTVFWAARPAQLENDFSFFFTSPPKDDPNKGVRAVRQLYDSIAAGQLSTEDDNRFYVLGLAPNAARIAVRFWVQGTVREFGYRIKAHFDDLEIARGPKDDEYFSLHRLLVHTALEFKISNVPPNLAGAVIQAILNGTPYPATLLQQCVRRIRAERNVTRIRAAIIKAYLNRHNRIYQKTAKEEFTVSLDKTNMNPAYRLGRLFSVLELIQEKASPRINTTIRDRFYGAAASSPVTVFPQLLKLKNHHVAKLPTRSKVYFESLIGEIVDGIKAEMPAHLALDDQGRFAVGYYHQRQDYFTKKNENQ